MTEPVLMAEGLSWPESPRWRDGQLWLSDVHNFRLVRLESSGALGAVIPIPGRPAGIGFMPDGRLLLATALDRKLLWVGRDGSLSVAADLGKIAKSYLNDMIVDSKGRAWVGDTGFVFGSGEPERPGALLVYDEVAGLRVAAENIRFPNGIAIAEDESVLYLAETLGKCITAFDIAPGGRLGNRRVHATLESAPDGLCLDATGHLWTPLLFQGEFHRIAPDGAVVERIAFAKKRAIACTLGGEDRHTLFLCVSAVHESNSEAPIRSGAVYSHRVEIPGAGLP